MWCGLSRGWGSCGRRLSSLARSFNRAEMSECRSQLRFRATPFGPAIRSTWPSTADARSTFRMTEHAENAMV